MNKPKSLKQVDIPDGYYFGTYGAYYVKLMLAGKHGDYESESIKMDQGTRGFSMANLEVKDGWVYVND